MFALSHVHSFFGHWVETCHCAEFRFSLDWRVSNWSTWTEPVFTVFFFLSSTVVTHWSLWSSTTFFGHWGALWPPWLPPLLEPTLVQLGELNSIPLSLTRHCQSFPWKGTTCWWPTHYASTNWPMRLFPLQRTWHPHWLDSKPQKQMISCLSLSQLWLWGQIVRN